MVRCTLSVVVVLAEPTPTRDVGGVAASGSSGVEIVGVDDRGGLFYATYAEALNAGINQASGELVVVIREGASLAAGWRSKLDEIVDAVAEDDDRWGVVALRGRTSGPCDDGGPRKPDRTVRASRAATPEEILRIGEDDVLVLRRSSGLRFDEDLPTADHCETDLALTAQQRGLGVYIVEAPILEAPVRATDGTSRPPDGAWARDDPTRFAERASAEAYFLDKWPGLRVAHPRRRDALPALAAPHDQGLDHPVVLLARGGSGSRLLSTLARDCGVFVGTDLNVSGDCLEMVPAIYQGVLEKHRRRRTWKKEATVGRLRSAASAMIRRASHPTVWGFKLPESMLLLPEIDAAFPRARYVHLIRDPLTTCLRRTHQTARLDSAIGRAAVAAGYRHCGVHPGVALDDDPPIRMALTTRHQLEVALSYCRTALSGRYLEIRFEQLLAAPGDTRAAVAAWLGVEAAGRTLESIVDAGRAARPSVTYGADVAGRVARRLAPLRATLGYER